MTSRFDEKSAAQALRPDSELPLLTVAWRAIREHHERLNNQRRLAEEESRRTQTALVELADDLYRLLSYVAAAKEPLCAETLKNLTDRLERSLQTVGIEVLAPVGEPFVDHWTELFENIAVQPEADITDPYIKEVVQPAIVYRYNLLRMGQAIIAVPKESDDG